MPIERKDLLLNIDALSGLKSIDDNSVDFCITSPPYWALRDYGVEGQLGQEPNVKDYIYNLSNIFDEVFRVLKKDGTLWVVINDTWFSTTKGSGGVNSFQPGNKGSFFKSKKYESPVKVKSLVNVPHRLAIEMTDNRNWIHRATVCWHKNNVMPTSAKDKPTRDFEYVLIFSKSPNYYFKQLLEPYKEEMNRWGGEKLEAKGKSDWDNGTGQETYRDRDLRPNKDGRNIRSVWELPLDFGPEENDIWTVNNRPIKGLKHYAVYPEELVRKAIEFGCPEGGIVLDPFLGSGTTGVVAKKMDRTFIGIELNPDYYETAKKRIYGD